MDRDGTENKKGEEDKSDRIDAEDVTAIGAQRIRRFGNERRSAVNHGRTKEDEKEPRNLVRLKQLLNLFRLKTAR
jgi:hypothetical protein